MFMPPPGVAGIGGNDAFTKVLLHMEGANGGTTFTDANVGGSAKTWTANGATTTTSSFPFGTSAGNFGSSVGWVQTPAHSDFNVGTDDFAVECRFNVGGGAGTRRLFFGQANASGTPASTTMFGELSSGNVMLFSLSPASGSPVVVVGTTHFTAPGWHTYLATRSGNVLRLFIDGIQEGGDVPFTGSVLVNNSDPFSVGRVGALPTSIVPTWNGLLKEFRFSRGTPRFISNYTPASEAYT